eukprot:scaffold129535_cov33-Tisochrysis_lutea.AAC.2
MTVHRDEGGLCLAPLVHPKPLCDKATRRSFETRISSSFCLVLKRIPAGEEADERPIAARTGPDPDDKESGGQPVRLSVAFQYSIAKKDVPKIYQTFGTLHEASYLRFAKQAITNEAQQFTPRAFWLQRARVRIATPHRYSYTNWVKPTKLPLLVRRTDG